MSGGHTLGGGYLVRRCAKDRVVWLDLRSRSWGVTHANTTTSLGIEAGERGGSVAEDKDDDKDDDKDAEERYVEVSAVEEDGALWHGWR